MPTSLLTCESCGNRQVFFLDEGTVAEMRAGKTTPKHCQRCHATTDWIFHMVDRRTGHDRRTSNNDRRTNQR